MSRADRRWRGKGSGLGRDELFRVKINPDAYDKQNDLLRGQVMGGVKRSKSKGGNKGGSWGPQADGD